LQLPKEQENIQRQEEAPIQVEEELKEEHEAPAVRHESDSSDDDTADSEPEKQENGAHNQKYGRLNLFGMSDMLMDGPPENSLLENYESSSEESGSDSYSNELIEVGHASFRSEKTMNFKIPIMQRLESMVCINKPSIELEEEFKVTEFLKY
jgi:hypothetical protein